MIDAPVSGGVGGATAGTLTFMVGGPRGAFAKAKPILEKMGKNIVHAGGGGSGQAAKICNNMILGISMIAVCEAFVLAEKLGLDAQKLFDVVSTRPGQCWSLTNYCPVPGPGADLARQPRLPGGLHRGDDAEGPEAGAAGGRRRRRRDAARRRGGAALQPVRQRRQCGQGFLRHHPDAGRQVRGMITLYDLVFDKDLRPSPFCWRAKLALKHKGLAWRDEPMGFTEKQKIAFAQSQTVPVIHDGTKVVKDSWAIALHLERPIPTSRCSTNRASLRALRQRLGRHGGATARSSRWSSAIWSIACGRRTRTTSSNRAASGSAPPTSPPSRPRRAKQGLAAFRAALEPARRVLKEQKFLSGDAPAYPDYILLGSFLWPRTISPIDLLEKDDAVHAWRERMLDLFDGMGRNVKAA